MEAAGIATISLSISPEITEKTPPPRALMLRFPFGHALGEKGKADQHHEVLRRAFEWLFEAREPAALKDAGLRWRREQYAPPDFAAMATMSPETPGGAVARPAPDAQAPAPS